MKKIDSLIIVLFFGVTLLIWLFHFYYGHVLMEEIAASKLPQYEIFLHVIFLVVLSVACTFIALLLKRNRDTENVLQNIFNNTIPISITDTNYHILMANHNYIETFGPIPSPPKGNKCYEIRPGPSCHTDECPMQKIKQGKTSYSCESKKKTGSNEKYFIVNATPFFDSKKRLIGIIESFQDITSRKKLEEEKNVLLNEVSDALKKVKQLSGLLPICASCKKIRDDNGYWNQIESYIHKHSEAEFSHGICPDCAERLYPELNLNVGMKKTNNA